MLATGSPWVSRRLSPEAVEDVTRSFFLTLWNTYSFFCLYARLEGFDPTRPAAGATDHPAGPLGPGRAGRHRRPGDPGPGRLRRHQRRPAAGRLRGRPVQLVRAAVAAALLARHRGGRRRGLPDAVDLPADGDPAAGPLRAVHGRGAVAGAGGLGRPQRPGLGPPGRLAGARPGRPRPGAERGHGRGQAAGRPRPPGPHRGQAQGAPAPGQGPDRRARPGQGRGGRAAGPGRGRAERQAGRLRRERGRAGRLPAGPELPGARSPVRARRPGGGRRPAPGPGRPSPPSWPRGCGPASGSSWLSRGWARSSWAPRRPRWSRSR